MDRRSIKTTQRSLFSYFSIPLFALDPLQFTTHLQDPLLAPHFEQTLTYAVHLEWSISPHRSTETLERLFSPLIPSSLHDENTAATQILTRRGVWGLFKRTGASLTVMYSPYRLHPLRPAAGDLSEGP